MSAIAENGAIPMPLRPAPVRFHAGFLLAPAVLFYAVLFVWPLIISTWGSFTPNGHFSFSTYTQFFQDAFYRSVLWRSLRISAITTVMTLVIGYPVAVYLSQGWRKGRSLVVFLVIAPMFVSAVVRSYGWIVILGPNGLLSSTMRNLDIPIGHLLYTEAGVIIALTHVFLPFMVLALTGSLQQIDPSLSRAARILGANGFNVFMRITLPLSLPGISAGSVIVFCLAASGFVTPALVGGSAVPVMPYLVYKEGLLVLNWPFASAVALILLVTTAFVTAAYTFLVRDGASKRSVVR